MSTRLLLLPALLVLDAPAALHTADPLIGPASQIVLRSCRAEVASPVKGEKANYMVKQSLDCS
jgi:hypothetical protein